VLVIFRLSRRLLTALPSSLSGREGKVGRAFGLLLPSCVPTCGPRFCGSSLLSMRTRPLPSMISLLGEFSPPTLPPRLAPSRRWGRLLLGSSRPLLGRSVAGCWVRSAPALSALCACVCLWVCVLAGCVPCVRFSFPFLPPC